MIYATSKRTAIRMRRQSLGAARAECEHAAPPRGCSWVPTADNPCGVLVCRGDNENQIVTPTPTPTPVTTPNIVPTPGQDLSNLTRPGRPSRISVDASVTNYPTDSGLQPAAYPPAVADANSLYAFDPLIASAAAAAPAVASTGVTATAAAPASSLSNIPLWGWALGAGVAAWFLGKA